MKKFILFLLAALVCIACSTNREKAYSKFSRAMYIDTVTIHGVKHEFLFNTGRNVCGIAHSPECWCLKK